MNKRMVYMRPTIIGGATFFLAAYFLPYTALAETVKQFDVSLIVRPDATLSIREEITYDFGTEDRHGIFRIVPYRYRTDIGNFTAEVSVQSVTSPSGAPAQYEVSRESGALRIRIGDPGTTITGTHTYSIEYDVAGPYLYFDAYDELYWNVTGNNWNVPIEEVLGSVSLPDGVAATQAACYRGMEGSTAGCAEAATTTDGFTFSDTGLAPYEGVTIAVAFPKGIVHEPTKIERAWEFFKDNWPVGVPLLALFGCLYLWLAYGRDPRGRGTIVPMYDPPEGLAPGEVGIIYDEYAQNKDLAAEIVHLAVQGYLKIHRVEEKRLLILSATDYILERKKEGSDLAKEFDRDLLSSLFASSNVKKHEVNGTEIDGVSLSDLKNKFSTEASKVTSSMYRSVVDKGYFLYGPQKVRGWFAAAGIALAIVGFGIGIIFFQTPVAIVSLALAGGIVTLFAFVMPVRTKQGVLAYEHILGFQDYVRTAEHDRLAFHNAPERTPERFDALLPFAMVLGVEKAWAKQFADLDREPPSWYGTSAGYAFAADTFINDINSFSSAAQTASTPASSGSGGGGSSGGGFGGGGGGSW